MWIQFASVSKLLARGFNQWIEIPQTCSINKVSSFLFIVILLITDLIHVVDDKIHDWLSPPDSSLKHREIRKWREEGTGDWLFQTVDFKRWRVTPGSLYCVYANRKLILILSIAS